MLDPRNGEVLALASTPTYDASAIADPATAKATFEALQADPAQPLLPRATLGRYVPGSVFKIVTAVAGLGSQAITPRHDLQAAARRREERPSRRRLPRPRRPPPGDRLDGARPHRGDRGVVQHLLRADRAQDRRRQARRVRQADGLRGAAAVRPPDRGLAGHQWRRVTAGRLQRRRRARQRGLWPGRDVRDAAPDGAGRLDRGERWGADAAPARHGDDRQRSGTKAIGPQSMGRVISPADAQAITTAMVQAVEGRSDGSSRRAPRSRA